MKLLSSEELKMRYLKVKKQCSLLVRVAQICNQAIMVLNFYFYTSSFLLLSDAIPGLHFFKLQKILAQFEWYLVF